MVEAVLGGSRRPVAPELVDQAVARDHLVRVEHEEREEGALLGTPNRNAPPARSHLEWPE
jgi:hypothetical protein